MELKFKEQSGTKARLDEFENKMCEIYTDIISKIEEERGLACERTFPKIEEKKTHSFLGVVNSTIPATILILSLITFLCSLIPSVVIHPAEHFQDVTNVDECVSEEYRFPFRQEMPLLGYLRYHEPLIGREWLFKILEDSIFRQNNKNNGIVALADMGFGKSALISHILCSKHSEKGRALRERTVAFHVCKFDVPSTHKAERFIQRLVGFFSLKSPQFGNIIATLDSSSVLYSLDKCSNDIVACFDQGITFPLKQIREIADVPWIVIIDALDECFDVETNSNNLLELIGQRTRALPKWIKFLITSRNITGIRNLKNMNYIELHFNDSRNIQDISLYMDIVYDELNYNLRSKTLFSNLKQMALKNEGSFMYITHAVEHFMQMNTEADDAFDSNAFPSTLGEIYAINFERHFLTPDSFLISKQILEIMGASLVSVTRNEINQVIRIGNNVSSIKIDESFEKLKYFINFNNETTGFKHQSIFKWLICESSDTFKISLNSGHSMIAKYIFSATSPTKNTDPVKLAIHVAKSKNKSLNKLFKSFKQTNQTLKIQKSDIPRLVHETDSVDALKLVLYYINEVDCLNSRGVTAAFVAAAFGHLEQFKYLIENGASVTFTLNSTCDHMFRSKWAYSYSKIIASDKTEYFCMYGLLHIAAQNGHSRISQYIAETNSSLINMTNRNGLRPSDLACENGHLKVLKVLEKFDANIFDERCVYYAAKYDHVDIIKASIYNGLKLECISDKMSVRALQYIQTRIFKLISGPPSPLIVEFVLDHWWIVFKETALHVAIRVNSLSAKDVLVEHFPKLLSCHDALGRTPFLSSIIYNHTDMFQELLEQRYTDTCNEIPAHIKIDNFKKLYEGFDDVHVCPKGAQFTHLIAYYDRLNMLEFIHNTGFLVDWNVYDGNYLTPLHYAACRSSEYFLSFSTNNANIDFDKRARYGISVWHTAIRCGHIFTIHYLTDNLKTKIPDIKDSQNRSLLMEVANRNITSSYLMFLSKTNKFQIDNYDNEMYLMLVHYFDKKCHHSIVGTDIYGRNVIHYALKSGQFGIIEYIRHNHQDKIKKLLGRKDIDGMTPITFATNTLKSKPLHTYHRTSIYDIFLNKTLVVNKYRDYFTPFEYGLILILMDGNLSDFYKDYVHHFDKILMYSPYLTSAVLTYHKQIPNDIIQGKLLESLDGAGPDRDSIIAFAYFKSEIIHKCNKHISKSPFHKMVYAVEFVRSIFLNMNIIDFFKVFGNPLKLKLSCSDQRGLNIYHYALLGGNIYTAKVLEECGIEITNSKISTNDIPYLVLSGKLISDVSNFLPSLNLEIGESLNIDKLDQFNSVDNFISSFIKRHRLTLKPGTHCTNNTSTLSLVHMLAAHGMIKSLQTVEKLFGKHMLHCINHHKITPLYLAHFFNHKNLVNYLENIHQLIMPSTAAEEHLILNILHDFHLFKNASDPLFCLTHPGKYSTKQTVRSRLNVQKCIQVFLIRPQDFTSTEQFLTIEYKYSKKYAEASKTMTDVNKYSILLFDLNELLTYTYYDTNLCSRLAKRVSKLFPLHCDEVYFYVMSATKVHKLCRMMKSLDFSQYRNSKSITFSISKCVLTKRFRIFLFRTVNTLESIVDILLNELRQFYIHNMYLRLKSSYLTISKKYDFADERMAELKFQESRINKSASILSEHVSQSYYKFNYFRILRPTLANKKLREFIYKTQFIFKGGKLFKGGIPYERHIPDKPPFADFKNWPIIK